VENITGLKYFIIKIIYYLKISDIYSYFRDLIFSHRIIIFTYHRIFPKQEDWWSVSYTYPEEFEHQINFINKHFKVLSLKELLELSNNGKLFTETYKRTAVITFDDGYKDNYIYAYPILKKYNIPATMFLATGFIDKNRVYWWDRVGYIFYHSQKKEIDLGDLGKFSLTSPNEKSNSLKRLLSKLKSLPDQTKEVIIDNLKKISKVEIPFSLGKDLMLSWEEIQDMTLNHIEFGAHTVNHPILTNIPLEQAEKEIIKSKQILEAKLQKNIKAFSYPNGKEKDFNDDMIAILAKSGFEYAVTTIQGFIGKRNARNVYRLKRVHMDRGMFKFKLRISGMYTDIYQLINKFKRRCC